MSNAIALNFIQCHVIMEWEINLLGLNYKTYPCSFAVNAGFTTLKWISYLFFIFFLYLDRKTINYYYLVLKDGGLQSIVCNPS